MSDPTEMKESVTITDLPVREVQTPAPKPSFLKYVGIPFFAANMGFSSLALVLRRLQRDYDWSPTIANVYGIIAGLVFVIFLVLFAIRFFKYRAAMVAEWRHPIKSSFFCTLPINFIIHALVLVDLWEEEYHAHDTKNEYFYAGATLCLLGVAIHTVMSFAILMNWLGPRPLPAKAITPVNLIPPVANLLMGLGLAKYQFIEAGWLYWASGFVLFLAVLAVILGVLFQGPGIQMPKLRTTFFILLAPGSIGAVGYMALTDGSFDTFTRILIYFSVFIWFLVMVIFFKDILPWMRTQYEVTWWAITFPSAATAVVSFDLARKLKGVYGEDQKLAQYFSWLLAAVDAVFVLVCLIGTIVQGFRGKLFVPEHEPKKSPAGPKN
eukprot:gnl/Dysnectes_brevis/990_a1102_5709.p1 GENE.gnl/Dysnectes_brevis/990_a1102_5709~~gnl/Dysnectes_brevis/990_a1102_5709.p1  ORF type:complete len:380 (-),score=124.79 gnl/Dysnectes_brevis/990_a1102_5709:58-1197(-)